jgi:hypothetical protein
MKILAILSMLPVLIFLAFAATAQDAPFSFPVRVGAVPEHITLTHVLLMNPGDMEDMGLSGGEIVTVCCADDDDPKRCVEVRIQYGAGVTSGVIVMDTYELELLGVEPGDRFMMELTVTDKKYLNYDYFPLYPGFTWLIRGYETPGETYTVLSRNGSRVSVRLESIPYTTEKDKKIQPTVSEVSYYVDPTGIWVMELEERAYLLMFPIEVGRTWTTYDMLMGLPSLAEIVDTSFSITQRGRRFEDCIKVILTGNYDLDNPDDPHTLIVVYAPHEGFLYQEPGERWRFFEEEVFERRWQ